MIDRKQQQETVREEQQLHGTKRDSERQPATMEDSERKATIQRNWYGKFDKASNSIELGEIVRDSQQL